jgi:hypothetical protein
MVLFNISLTFIGLQIIDEQVNNLESYVMVPPSLPTTYMDGFDARQWYVSVMVACAH